ncbi:MAG TPA: zf-HC2 domain-containing protein [Acidobacteriaceae bacterium]
MTCTEFLAQLDEMLDQDAALPLRADLEEHLRECEHCEITLNTTRKTIQIYRSHELYELPDDLRERLHKAILAKCRKC